MEDIKNRKIKWCFLVTPYPFLMELLGKLAYKILENGDECFLITNSKFADWSRLQFFPKGIKVYSKVDWSLENFKESQEGFENFSWKEFFTDSDRWKLCHFGYKDITRIISQLYQFVSFVFEKEKPDVVVYGMIGSFVSEVVYGLCQKHNIKYITLTRSRIPQRIDVFDLDKTCSKYKKTFHDLGSNAISEKERNFADNLVKDFVSHKKVTTYMNYQVNHRKGFFATLKKYLKREKKMAQACFKYLLRRKRLRLIDYESEIQFKYFITYPLTFLKRNLKIFLLKNIYNRFYGSSNNDDKFFLYPLQQQPELSSSFLATYYYNQLNTITNIAFALPFPCKLYVKEHPVTFGVRSKDFYKNIKKIPNVVLIPPSENSENLIRKSQGVIVLTCTIGMEAALLGKPVYLLGEALYSYHPLCRNVNNFDDLREKIKEDLNKPAENNLRDINIRFILSYYNNNIACDFDLCGEKNDPNDYKLIYEEIKRKFL